MIFLNIGKLVLINNSLADSINLDISDYTIGIWENEILDWISLIYKLRYAWVDWIGTILFSGDSIGKSCSDLIEKYW